MKKIIFSILVLTIFIVGCAEKVTLSNQVDDIPTADSSEVVEINDGLNDLNDLETITNELDDVNLDDLDNINLE